MARQYRPANPCLGSLFDPSAFWPRSRAASSRDRPRSAADCRRRLPCATSKWRPPRQGRREQKEQRVSTPLCLLGLLREDVSCPRLVDWQWLTRTLRIARAVALDFALRLTHVVRRRVQKHFARRNVFEAIRVAVAADPRHRAIGFHVAALCERNDIVIAERLVLLRNVIFPITVRSMLLRRRRCAHATQRHGNDDGGAHHEPEVFPCAPVDCSNCSI